MGKSIRFLSGLWLLVLILFGSTGVEARYIGGEPPNKCSTCGCACGCAACPAPNIPSCGCSSSYTEGNFGDGYSGGATVSSAFGPTLNFSAVYNSKQADGSQSRSNTVMGYGWTHSYNTLLFSQRGHMFRLAPDGRVTKYTLGVGGKFTVTPGYFETLVKNPDGSFTLRQKDGTTYQFAQVPGTPFLAEGPVWRLISITDRNNNVTTLTYVAGKLTQVTNTYGQSLTFSYIGNLLTQVTDPLGRITRFTYSAGTLVQITDPENKSVQYSYNSLAQVIRKVDKDGRVFTYKYNGAQKPVGITDGGGNPILSITNINNWATDETVLAMNLLRQYVPSTTSKTDGRGNVWTYQYDKNGYITKLTAPDGAITRYSYDAATLQVASMTDANNRTTSYQYDTQGNLTNKTDALGFVTSFTYEPVFNMMTSMTDTNGRTTIYQYDASGNRIKETDPLVGTREWSYDSHGNVTSDKDKNGNVTTYDYDGFGNRVKITDALLPIPNVTTMTYDTVGNMISRTNARGFTTSYQYDGLNRLVNETRPVGDPLQADTSFFYDGQGNRVEVIDRNDNSTTYQYDLRQRLVKSTDALGQTMKYTYDGNDNRTSATDKNNHTTTFEYDVQNRLVKTIDAIGNMTTMTYDGVGNRLTETDANGHTTSYQYDALNRMNKKTDAEANITQMFYDMVGGCPECTGPTRGSSLLTKQIDAEDKVTYFKYDGLDRPIIQNRKQTDTADVIDGDDAVTRFTYDAQSNRLTMVEPNGNMTSYAYDALNRQVQMTNAAGDVMMTSYDPVSNVKTVTAPNLNVTIYTYDALDRRTRVDDSVGLVATYTYDAVGNRLTEKDGNGNGTTNTYDTIYRITDVTDALGKSTHYDYDAVGNLLKLTDREGNATTYVYDDINRRTQMTDALGKVTKYQYDGVGNLTRITDANTHATDYAYDNINRRVNETYADGRMRTFTYDRVSNLKTRTDQKGQVTSYSYSDLYFLTKRDYPVSSDDNMSYDLSGRMLSAERGGWLVTFAYDGANRVTTTVQNGKTLNYTYNIPGRTRTVIYPGGRSIVEATDARSRLGMIDDAGLPPPIVQYIYDLGNRVISRVYRNGSTASYSYNANNWITALDHAKADSTRIAGFTHDFDNEGNKRFEKKRADAANSQTKSEAYQYDKIYRLIDYKVGTLAGSTVPVPATQIQYTLDSVGNWNVKTKDAIPETRMHSVTNEIVQIAAVTVLSDFNGNTNEDGQYRYNYDEENRLIRVSRKSDQRVVGRYEYDALSRRIKKIANPAAVSSPVETRYFYDSARIVEEQDTGGATLATYVYGNYIDEILTMDRAGTFYYHQNSLWSVEAITNAASSIVERYAYDAYGLPTITNGAGMFVTPNSWGTAHSAIGNPWMFTGRQFDEETGLYFYRARYYDSDKGRFIQRDPLGYVDGMNLYAYVRDNPIDRIDPLGLEEECKPKCGLDITDKLAKGLAKVKAEFLAKTSDEQEEICISTRRMLGWDINILIGESPKNLLTKGDCGVEPCAYTVTVNGECHYAAAVNYKLYGTLSRLCRDNLPRSWKIPFPGTTFSEWVSVNVVRTYRGVKSGLGLWGEGVGPAVAWTRAGYNNDDSLASSEKLDAKCPSCDRKFSGIMGFRAGPKNIGWAGSGVEDLFTLWHGAAEDQPHHIMVDSQ
jgi:RHS repeat-associated protein